MTSYGLPFTSLSIPSNASALDATTSLIISASDSISSVTPTNTDGCEAVSDGYGQTIAGLGANDTNP